MKNDNKMSVNETQEFTGKDWKDPVPYRILGMEYRLSAEYTEAMKYFKIAAEYGDSEAQRQLSIMYRNGEGTDRNFEKAFQWCKMSMDNENGEALYTLATICEAFGRDTEILQEYIAADESKFASSYVSLLCMYRDGFGAEKDLDKALEYGKLALKYDSTCALEEMELLYKELNNPQKAAPPLGI